MPNLPVISTPPSTDQSLPRHAGSLLGQCSGRADSLYVHVPFCFHKCHYCDFYSIVDTQDRQETFVTRLMEEIAALTPWIHRPLRTVFVGGGTPSLLAVPLWERLLSHLKPFFPDDRQNPDQFEFTVECNPETVNSELMRVLHNGGVTRISVGAQSFDTRHLQTLERWHDPHNVGRAIELARAEGIARQSLDLIFAIPGQTMSDWLNDLREGLKFKTEHLSCYGLTYETGTAMTARLARREFARADEDLEADMFEATLDVLESAGLSRYEVSNFARPGSECRHNLAYWRQNFWLAAGPSASGHLSGWRWKNSPRLDDYLRRGTDGFSPIIDVEPPDAGRELRERVMTGLRLREGIDAKRLISSVGLLDEDAPRRIEGVVHRMADQGLLNRGADRLRLTRQGFMLTNLVVQGIMDAITAA